MENDLKDEIKKGFFDDVNLLMKSIISKLSKLTKGKDLLPVDRRDNIAALQARAKGGPFELLWRRLTYPRKGTADG